jgi:hypothetical protein
MTWSMSKPMCLYLHSIAWHDHNRRISEAAPCMQMLTCRYIHWLHDLQLAVGYHEPANQVRITCSSHQPYRNLYGTLRSANSVTYSGPGRHPRIPPLHHHQQHHQRHHHQLKNHPPSSLDFPLRQHASQSFTPVK